MKKKLLLLLIIIGLINFVSCTPGDGDYGSSTGVASGQCKAFTQKGKQCTRNASKGSSYCWQHQ